MKTCVQVVIVLGMFPLMLVGFVVGLVGLAIGAGIEMAGSLFDE